MSLVDLLTNIQKGSVDDDQGPWRQYILDHRNYIIRRSRNYQLDEALMNRYRYDLKRFLKEHLKRNNDIAWIVLLINGLANDFEFVDVTDILIPLDETISNLFQLYNTVIHNAS